MRRSARVGLGAALTLACFGALTATGASAHPLGNFSINHLDSLRLTPSSIVDRAIVDIAEIPAAQLRPTLDADGDGDVTPTELAAHATTECETYRSALTLSVAGAPVTLSTTASSLAFREGQAGLQTLRLECTFNAAADLTTESSVSFSNSYEPGRVGWHEIVAVGDGTHLDASPVPSTSVTGELSTYPSDLLSSPLDVRSAELTVLPGAGASTVSADEPAAEPSAFSSALGPFSRLVDRVTGTFNDLVGRHDLTLGVGLLAIALALLLGASHALLPGHGKTVMAAYIAGRQGSVRDAVIVGATVTATHTGGVLILGLALTLSTSLAGESVLASLGIASGAMITVLGASLLRSVIRRRRAGLTGWMHGSMHGGHTHSHGGHSHSHGDETHTHDEATHSHDPQPIDIAAAGGAALLVAQRASVGVLDRRVVAVQDELGMADRRHDHDHDHAHPHPHPHDRESQHVSRLGLIGMGIAGGLVPSPSALVVLLSAIALGRTVFGVVLVIGYGLGMAGTLTLAGVLLVRVRDRYQQRIDASRAAGRVRRIGSRWTTLAPFGTAALVLVVGIGLVVRSVGSL